MRKGSGKFGDYKRIAECKVCGKDFQTTIYKINLGEGQFCSKACGSKFHKNAYKEKIGYRGIHTWIILRLGKPKKCEHCKKDGLTGRKIHWANISHLYKRSEEDWIRLCAKCHGKYDKINNLRKK